MQCSVRGYLHIRNRNKNVPLFQVHIFNFMYFLINQDKVQYAVLGNIHDISQIFISKNGIPRKFHMMDNRIRYQFVIKLYALRNFRKRRRNLGKYTCAAKGCHIISYTFSRNNTTRFALQQRIQFRFDFSRNTFEIDSSNRFTLLRSNCRIIFCRQIQGCIAHSHCLLRLLHRKGICLPCFIGNFPFTCGLSTFYINHGALGHIISAPCHLRCFRKNTEPRNRNQYCRYEQSLSPS